ncbi:MAG: hypothetical protein PHW63_07710 [Alphaproteobacteria bacterium]|nr:hypothetical protein [Alphaproteobacteria bacterium]
MSNATFDHSDMWTGFRDGETGLEVGIFDDGEIIVEKFFPDEFGENVVAYIRPSLEDWKRIRDMAEKNVRQMEQ